MVAAVDPSLCGSLTPRVRAPKPEHDLRMPDRRGIVIADEPPQPRNAVALYDVIGIHHALDARNRRHVAANHDWRPRRKPTHHSAHLAYLANVNNDRRDSDDIVMVGPQFGGKCLMRGEVQHGGWCRDVLLDHQDAPRAVEHSERERSLLARHLIVVQLHGIDAPAAEFIVLRIRTEDAGQQHSRAITFGMGHDFGVCVQKN